jgi:DNA repair exonuclease SbcCD nuclease subunit
MPSQSFPAINYEDRNFNVGIPVFSIHGNHDDPQGAGPEGALCALDLLSVAGVINYIGKSDLSASDDPNAGIQIKPVLLRKGATQLALYGVGNVKDQRMHFELRSNRVKMFMPKDKDNWFNILLVHQNRYVPWSYSPSKLDMILTYVCSVSNEDLLKLFQKACLTIALISWSGATSTTAAFSLNLLRAKST